MRFFVCRLHHHWWWSSWEPTFFVVVVAVSDAAAGQSATHPWPLLHDSASVCLCVCLSAVRPTIGASKSSHEEFQTSVTPWQKNVNPMRNPNSLRSCRTGASTIVAETFGGRADPELNSGLHAAIWVVMNCVVFFLIEC
uniref:Secreted protein n=1 Tax=Physcomitrium patens TaxID=3218 RepID=A0A2K1JS77_PHYPA|nr:hypothetical protein PHYPA_016700 [Physcomitrium patens]